MKQIFQNLRNFFRKDKMILLVTTLCTFVSAFLLYFSFGIYQNAHAMKEEAEIDMKQLDITPVTESEESLLTKELLCRYLSALSPSVLDDAEIIYTSSVHPPYFERLPEEGGGYDRFHYRFRIQNGSYGISVRTKESWENNGMIISGRYLTDEEEATGAKVAVVANAHGSGRNPQTIAHQISENEIELFGETYQIVGEYSGGWSTPVIPFLSIPNNSKLDILSFVFSSNITRSQYNEMKLQADITIPGILEFPELDFPDTDTMYLYNNVMLISVLLSLLSAINFAMLYHYILEKRNRTLATFRICGCTKGKAVIIYLGECLILSIPFFLIGAFAFHFIMKRWLVHYFPYIKGAFGFRVYAALFGIYLAVLLFVLIILIASHIKKQIMDEWRS